MLEMEETVAYEDRVQIVGSRRSPKERLVEIRDYMNVHYNEPLSIAQLALMADMNPKYFGDLFKKLFGHTAIDHLTNLRISRAKRYLTESDDRLRDIAQKVGYSDEFYFSRKFKKEVGVSPSDYAKAAKPSVVVYSPALIGQLLALQIMPVAAPLDAKWTPYYFNMYHDQIKHVLKLSAPYINESIDGNVDQLSQIHADQIIGTDELPEEERVKLMQLAPLRIVQAQANWKQQLRQIAVHLHKEECAETWISAYEQRVVLAREQIGEVLGEQRVLVLRISGERMYAYCNRAMQELFVQDLRLQIVNSGDMPRRRELTIEELIELDPAHIMLLVCAKADSRAYWLGLQHDLRWRGLAAVRSGCVHPIYADPWFEYSALSVARMLEEMLLLFTGKCPKALQDKVHGCMGE
ncbi:helix-turn-helix domain-containing protein [Paenibacillus radicibacter]|uniref:helix-turn-helix domain-containing protein n=1 Tax=Paenibacillus radicibacter TaxID=2972488 RepID=UPI002158B35D|nr:helix-turn-helix domain-containing protein [Paenibacillus radicibacter]